MVNVNLANRLNDAIGQLTHDRQRVLADSVSDIEYVIAAVLTHYNNFESGFQVSFDGITEGFTIEFSARDKAFKIKHRTGYAHVWTDKNTNGPCFVVHENGNFYAPKAYETIVLAYKDAIIESIVAKLERKVMSNYMREEGVFNEW